MHKCQKCDTLLEIDSKFCTNCGEKVSDETLKKIETEKPISKARIFTLKTVSFILAMILTLVIKVILMAMGLIEATSDVMKGGLFLFLGLWFILSGFFIKDSKKKKQGMWILIAYVLLSIALSFYLSNSSYGINEQLRQMSYKTPMKIDENTELSKVTTNGNNVSFKYKLKNVLKHDLSHQERSIFRKTVKNELCQEKDFIKMMKYNKIITLYYYDKQGYLISQVVLSTKKCR